MDHTKLKDTKSYDLYNRWQVGHALDGQKSQV